MTKLTWPAVGLIGVLGVIAILLATLAHWESGAILGCVGVLAGIGGGAAVAGGAAVKADDTAAKVDDVQAATTAQSVQLTRIERRVNGELDERIETAVHKANERLIQSLRDLGVIG